MNWLINHPQLVLLTGFAYEVIVRLIPTTVNLSIVDKFKQGMMMAHSLFDIVVPNKRINEE